MNLIMKDLIKAKLAILLSSALKGKFGIGICIIGQYIWSKTCQVILNTKFPVNYI